jgi:glycosyltransferase involved in cell wall biosynthesis
VPIRKGPICPLSVLHEKFDPRNIDPKSSTNPLFCQYICRTVPPMRILIATSTFPITADDGLPRFVYDLARAMAELCAVTVLAPHHPGADRQESMGRLTVRRFQYAWPAGTQRLAYGSGMRENWGTFWPARLQAPAYLAALAMAVKKLSHGRRFDVINSHWLVPQSLGVALASGRRRPWAHVATAHAGDVSVLETLPMGKQVTAFIAGRTELFLPVSDHLGRRLQQLAGRRVPWAAQPMGVDYRRFSQCPRSGRSPLLFGDNFVLFVGRLVEKKGAAGLLEAMARLFPEFPGLGGTLESDLKSRANALGIAARVRFLGRRGHADILPYLHACRVLVIPSTVDARGETEGMPTILAEALAAGCRVVAGRVAGITDLIDDGRNGWLARPEDPADLAQKVRQALCCQDDRVAQQARQTVRSLDWKHVAGNYLRHFEAVLKKSGKRDE